jgi:hypothetical protein
MTAVTKIKNSNAEQIRLLNTRVDELLRERDDLLKANQVLHNLLTNREAEVDALKRNAQRPFPIPTPAQIEPILDDFLGVDSPHYEELRRRCAQRIFDLCAVTSGIPITPSDNRISSAVTSTMRQDVEKTDGSAS